MPKKPKPSAPARYLADVAERVAATYIETYLGLWVGSGIGVHYLTDLSTADKALVACLPALAALVKGAVAKKVGADDSASLLPADTDPPQKTP